MSSQDTVYDNVLDSYREAEEGCAHVTIKASAEVGFAWVCEECGESFYKDPHDQEA